MPYSFNKILHQTKNFFAYRFVRTYIANSANNAKTNVILSVSKVSKQKDSSGKSPQNDWSLIVPVVFAI